MSVDDGIQIQKLSQQMANLYHISGCLFGYRKKLYAAWPSVESSGFRNTADQMAEDCRKLEAELRSLREDIIQAIFDIQMEAENVPL